jgi:hypothetical protein
MADERRVLRLVLNFDAANGRGDATRPDAAVNAVLSFHSSSPTGAFDGNAAGPTTGVMTERATTSNMTTQFTPPCPGPFVWTHRVMRAVYVSQKARHLDLPHGNNERWPCRRQEWFRRPSART